MNSTAAASGEASGTAASLRTTMASSPFTLSQWQELEHQALIFKYLNAGVPVPSDLLLPIQKSFESLSARLFPHPSVAYCSFYGKKVDPEPGRCRRTDGKKWRCSKDVYPDSKYCERHMHRGRNRSRKPVESQTAASQPSPAMAPLTVSGSGGGGSGGGGAGILQNLSNFSSSHGGLGSGTNPSHFSLDSMSYGTNNKDYRYIHGYKSEVGEHSFMETASGSSRGGLQMDSPLESTWPLMSLSRVASYPPSKLGVAPMLQSDYPQHSFFSGEFSSGEPVKPEGHSLRPFFDEWPKARDSWPALEEERSNQTSFSTTQLSISIPNASSDFSVSSRSPHPTAGSHSSQDN